MKRFLALLVFLFPHAALAQYEAHSTPIIVNGDYPPPAQSANTTQGNNPSAGGGGAPNQSSGTNPSNGLDLNRLENNAASEAAFNWGDNWTNQGQGRKNVGNLNPNTNGSAPNQIPQNSAAPNATNSTATNNNFNHSQAQGVTPTTRWENPSASYNGASNNGTSGGRYSGYNQTGSTSSTGSSSANISSTSSVSVSR